MYLETYLHHHVQVVPSEKQQQILLEIMEKMQHVSSSKMLNSFPAVKLAADMIYKVTLLCQEGGLNLMNFPSNHVSVLRSIPNELRKDGVKDKDLNLDTLPENKALGVKFNIQENTLGFIIRVNDKPVTKRELQAALSSVYDFIGLGSPFH